MGGANPDQLERLWRQRMKDAQLRLDFARNYLKEVQRDFPSGTVPPPDGVFAHHKALRAENAALAEYHRVLRVYTDLVLHGTIPAEKESARAKTGSASGEGNPQ